MKLFSLTSRYYRKRNNLMTTINENLSIKRENLYLKDVNLSKKQYVLRNEILFHIITRDRICYIQSLSFIEWFLNLLAVFSFLEMNLLHETFWSRKKREGTVSSSLQKPRNSSSHNRSFIQKWTCARNEAKLHVSFNIRVLWHGVRGHKQRRRNVTVSFLRIWSLFCPFV